MAWQDRDYYRGGGAGDFLSNPASILGFSVPFGTWLGVRVRLHFWLLVTMAIALAGILMGASPLLVVIQLAMLLFCLLVHDFGHRFFAQLAGGQHDEFMLWPAGGMVFPSMPPGPWAMFVGHVGGIVVNALLAVGAFVVLHINRFPFYIPYNPLGNFGGFSFDGIPFPRDLYFDCVLSFGYINWGLVLVNFLPYYWFDGGYLLQSILWPFAGGHTALNVTCIIGMILAVPMFFISLTHSDFLGMVMWVLLLCSSYTARKTMEVPETEPASTGWRSRSWANRSSSRAAAKRKRDEQKIDAILAKVSAQGMHSLTWFEKRTLRKGSQKLR